MRPHAEHFVAQRIRDGQLSATFVQRHVDQVPVPAVPPSVSDARSPRIHQDVFAEVPGGQAEVNQGGAKGKGCGQLEEDEVVLVVV